MAKCGHINRHSYGSDGEPDNLKCTLEAGHPGLHEAEHYEVASQLSGAYEGAEFKHVVINGKDFYEANVVRRWSDMAGIPADEIEPNHPGVQLIQAYDMFPEKQQEEMNEMRSELEALKALLAKQEKPARKKPTPKKTAQEEKT